MSYDEQFRPDATMVGPVQEQWFETSLTTSDAQWNVVANQVMIAQLKMPSADDEVLYNMDQWDGSPAARQRLSDFWRAQNRNPAFITRRGLAT